MPFRARSPWPPSRSSLRSSSVSLLTWDDGGPRGASSRPDRRAGYGSRSRPTYPPTPYPEESAVTHARTALVTGAARGIGAATARRLAKDGYAVAVVDLDEAACEVVAGQIREAGGSALGAGIDVTDAEQVEAGVLRVADELGPPVVLVNNAGIIR